MMEKESDSHLPPSGERSQFVRVAPLYDTLMHDVPYAEWVNYLHKLLAMRNATPRRILDLACGTGNVAERLSAEGYAVTGVDIARDMIVEARRKAAERSLPIPYFVQDAAELDLPDQKFDLCVSLFDSMNYITDPQRFALAIKRVGQHLCHHGLFIFDMNSEFALINKFFDQSNRTSNSRLRYDWDSEYFPESRLCRVSMRFWYREDDGTESVFDEEHWQFAYREDEVIEMLQAAGFEDVIACQAYTLRPTHRTSDRIFYVAQNR